MPELDLRKFLDQYKGTEVDFFRFPGNYGDSLIWHGTMKLLDGLDIQVNEVTSVEERNHPTLLIDGGGNLVDYYHDVRDFLASAKDVYPEIVILPHTIAGEKQAGLLQALKRNVTIFCREKVSHQFVSKHANTCNVFLWHDTAFYNDLTPSPSGEGSLNAFRQDVESIQEDFPSNNIDISRDGYAKKPLDAFLRAIKPYAEINTDRLHVAIAATLLGSKLICFLTHITKTKRYLNTHCINTQIFD